ncbi:MAG: hypothetical protein M3525_10335 [Acidobacteriota bacterium]|nr:hypothetical protein [Acidobacteriota bacterium]
MINTNIQSFENFFAAFKAIMRCIFPNSSSVSFEKAGRKRFSISSFESLPPPPCPRTIFG